MEGRGDNLIIYVLKIKGNEFSKERHKVKFGLMVNIEMKKY